ITITRYSISHFGGQHKFMSSVRDMLSYSLFRSAVTSRSIDESYSAIENRIKNSFNILFVNPKVSDLTCAVTQSVDRQTRIAESSQHNTHTTILTLLFLRFYLVSPKIRALHAGTDTVSVCTTPRECSIGILPACRSSAKTRQRPGGSGNFR